MPVQLPIIDLSNAAGVRALEKLLHKLRSTASAQGQAGQTVARIVDDVRQQGDKAVVKYMRQWTDPKFNLKRICVTAKELDRADTQLDPALRKAIQAAIRNVRQYQRHIMPRDSEPITIAGAELGLKFSPVDSAGLLVPGGSAVLFSTLIMLAVPALVAGVDPDSLCVVSPPPTVQPGNKTGDISPIVLATCQMLGIKRVYRIGGAQAVAALAFGTDQVQPVDMVAGPGNVYVQLAKAQLNGIIGTDNGFYGPSEIVTIADTSARPERIAADLLAQAEHNPGKCFLVAWSRSVIDAIQQQIQIQRPLRNRGDAIDSALAQESAAILVSSPMQAAQIANRIAAEHVNLAVKNPSRWLKQVRHGGEFFLGDQTPVAAGDYWAGPSHCLPTGTTARFASGVSVYNFLKRSGTVHYPKGMSDATIDAIALLAKTEGLDAHAHSVRVRGNR